MAWPGRKTEQTLHGRDSLAAQHAHKDRKMDTKGCTRREEWMEWHVGWLVCWPEVERMKQHPPPALTHSKATYMRRRPSKYFSSPLPSPEASLAMYTTLKQAKKRIPAVPASPYQDYHTKKNDYRQQTIHPSPTISFVRMCSFSHIPPSHTPHIGIS